MKLRFQILSPNNTGTPDYNICSQASSNVALTNTSLKVVIDGTTILDTTNLATYTLPNGTITTTTNSIAVSSIQRVNTNFIEMTIAMTTIQEIDAIINVSKVGYLPYNNIFKLFGYDLGNNLNQNNTGGTAITYNPNMDIYLVNETNNVVGGNQTKAFSVFTHYRKPFTNDIYLYNLSSTQGAIKYVDANSDNLLTVPNGFITEKATIDIQQVVEISGYINGVYSTISSCSTLLLTASSEDYIPTYEVSTNCETNCGINECSTTIDSLNKASTFIDYSGVVQLYINDAISYPYPTQTIEYSLIDFTGNEINSQAYSFTLTSPTSYVYNHSTYDWSNFPIPEVGDYVLQIKIGSPNIYTCTKTLKIKSCNWFEIQQTSCDEYTITNNSFDDLSLVITKLNDTKVFEAYKTIVFGNLSSVKEVLATDGLYKFSVTRNSKEYSFIVVNYCAIKNCLIKYISSILCPEDCGCEENKDTTNFNSTVMLAITFFNMLNSEYNFNYIYESIESDKLDSLFEISTVLNKLNENCADNDCDC